MADLKAWSHGVRKANCHTSYVDRIVLNERHVKQTQTQRLLNVLQLKKCNKIKHK